MRTATGVIALCALLTLPATGTAQTAIEVYGGVGYTAVDVDAWSGTSTGAEDWDQVAFEGYVQVFTLQAGNVSLGLEAAYEYLFWYDVLYLGSTLTREVEATRILALARFDLAGPTFAELGAGAHLFDGFTDIGIAAGVGYLLPVNERISVPLKLRGDYVMDPDASLLVTRGSVGVRYSF